MNKTYIAILAGAGSFLAAWQATDFALDHRAILGAVTCAVLGYASPKATKKS